MTAAPRRLGSWAAGLVLAAMGVGACQSDADPVDRHAWTFAFPATDTMKALPVTVSDHTGVVVGAGWSNGFNSFQKGPRAVAGRPDMLAVGWLGGACDLEVAINVTNPGRWQVDIRTDEPNACILVGISREVVIQTREPIDPSTVDVITDGRSVRR